MRKPKSIVVIIAEGLDMAGPGGKPRGWGIKHQRAANLAKAAPDLLAALKAAEAFLRGFEDAPPEDRPKCLRMVRAAIAKAKGKAGNSPIIPVPAS